MRATRTLLSDVQVLVEVDRVVGAELYAVAAARALRRVDDDKAVVPLVLGAVAASFHARGVVAVHAEMGPVGNLYLGDRAAHPLFQLEPEMVYLGHGLGYRRPVVGHVLVLTADMAAVAAVAYAKINYKYFLSHYLHPFSTHAEDFRPAARS